MNRHPTLIVHNARIHTGVAQRPEVQALAVHGDHIAAVGTNGQIRSLAGPATLMIDAGRRRVIPGLIDAHIHLMRYGPSYNLDLRWDGVPTLAEAMRLLAEQVARTPATQWVRVVGGFCEHQFAERRLPTLDELNQVAPSTPVLIIHLGDRALLNGAALLACGYTRDTPDPPGAHMEWDASGSPTGLLLAAPNLSLLDDALSHAPSAPYEYQLNAMRHFMRELNRLGVTSVIDAGAARQRYPDDHRVIEELQLHHLLSVRVAYHLGASTPHAELGDYTHLTSTLHPGQGDAFYRLNGAGELLVHAAVDFSNFRQPRPATPPSMEVELEPVIRHLAANRWPWRMHATYDETISHALDVFERVDREIPLHELHWFFDHAETVSEHNLERIARLGGGITVQPRMAYQGEYFAERYGAEATAHAPPFRRMLELGVHAGVGSDAARLGSYDPWIGLHWLTTGTTLGGLSLYPRERCLDRASALAMYTHANSWFTGEEGIKGQLDVGQLADFAVLSDDYFDVADEDIRQIVSDLTVVDGRIVYADGPFQMHDPAPLPAMPEWSPVNHGITCWRAPRNTAGAQMPRGGHVRQPSTPRRG
ncbi:amidohydrolase [Dyella solisilvae]|uniref:Amidohydrolase n=1 Tax=Dyella solisilvae TaxID=1920168 RepID=A0A370K3X9_9GAMM|nr:amidohydrolase [Dyella solisilvae]RDI97366.1 amidohydrolase [Dyella solisilvae]